MSSAPAGAADTAVRASIVVDAPPDEAFRVFTEDIGSWWNPDHHILDGELAEMIFEPRVGGHVIDRATDGKECCWARVLAYEPPRRLIISWDINLQWQLERDPARTSEVELHARKRHGKRCCARDRAVDLSRQGPAHGAP